jgi:glutamine synthetase adenylyltransferase
MAWKAKLEKIFGDGVNQDSLEKADEMRRKVDVENLDAFDDVLEQVTTNVNSRIGNPVVAQDPERAEQATERAVVATEAVHERNANPLTKMAFVSAQVAALLTLENITGGAGDAAAKAETKQVLGELEAALNQVKALY